jgi:hypothetical protein
MTSGPSGTGFVGGTGDGSGEGFGLGTGNGFGIGSIGCCMSIVAKAANHDPRQSAPML